MGAESLMTSPSINCPQKEQGIGHLVCKGADTSGNRNNRTNQIDNETCNACDAGKIVLEKGCTEFTARVRIQRHLQIIDVNTRVAKAVFTPKVLGILCLRKGDSTTLESCRACTLVTSEETERICNEALTLFESAGFANTKKELEDARRELLRNANYAGCITSSISSFESTMKAIMDKKGRSHNAADGVSDLWKLVKQELSLGDEIAESRLRQVVGSLSGAISGMGSIRNALSDAHGRGVVSTRVFISYAELIFILSASLSTFLIRRFLEEDRGE
jgi:hypothetical protein